MTMFGILPGIFRMFVIYKEPISILDSITVVFIHPLIVFPLASDGTFWFFMVHFRLADLPNLAHISFLKRLLVRKQPYTSISILSTNKKHVLVKNVEKY